MTDYYLDTSALVERWTGDARVRQEIVNLLAEGRHSTSTHVEREWKRVIDGTTADILNALGEGRVDLQSIYARLSQGRGRQAGQRLRVLAMLLNQNRHGTAVELRLRALRILRYGSREMLAHPVEEVRNGSRCGLAKNDVTLGPDGRYSLSDTCRRNDDICRQDDFVDEHLDRWTNASQGLVEHSPPDRPADRKMGDLGLELASNPGKRKGKNCYDRTGDISIAQECFSHETLLTTDRSYEAIADETGISVKRIGPTAPP